MTQSVEALRVQLTGNTVCDERGNIGDVWDATKVKGLVVFPDTRNARCFIRGTMQVSTYRGYTPVADSQQQWEGATDFACEECGMTFQNSQGLGSHRVKAHGKKAK